MGIETAIGLSLLAVGAGGQIYSGMQANDQAKDAAQLERVNSVIASWETNDAIASKTEEMTQLKEAQKMAMLKSGMNLAGSNLLVLEDTKRQLSISVGQLKQRQAIADLNSSYKVNSLLKSGRAAMIGGYTNAAATVGSYFVGGYKPSGGSAKSAGAWNGTSSSGLTNGESGYTGSLGGMA